MKKNNTIANLPRTQFYINDPELDTIALKIIWERDQKLWQNFVVILLTSGLTEVLTPRKSEPRTAVQRCEDFQRWGKIWTEKPARSRSRLSPVIFV
jgi:hypothetical protein